MIVSKGHHYSGQNNPNHPLKLEFRLSFFVLHNKLTLPQAFLAASTQISHLSMSRADTHLSSLTTFLTKVYFQKLQKWNERFVLVLRSKAGWILQFFHDIPSHTFQSPQGVSKDLLLLKGVEHFGISVLLKIKIFFGFQPLGLILPSVTACPGRYNYNKSHILNFFKH